MNYNEHPARHPKNYMSWPEFIFKGLLLIAAVFVLCYFFDRILSNAREYQQKADQTEIISPQADSDKLE